VYMRRSPLLGILLCFLCFLCFLSTWFIAHLDMCNVQSAPFLYWAYADVKTYPLVMAVFQIKTALVGLKTSCLPKEVGSAENFPSRESPTRTRNRFVTLILSQHILQESVQYSLRPYISIQYIRSACHTPHASLPDALRALMIASSMYSHFQRSSEHSH
jgi:hypothetical protein